MTLSVLLVGIRDRKYNTQNTEIRLSETDPKQDAQHRSEVTDLLSSTIILHEPCMSD